MNTLAHPPLHLLQRRQPRTTHQPAARPTLLQRFEAWLDRLPEPKLHHGMGSWTALR
jgi:hypothetical protein